MGRSIKNFSNNNGHNIGGFNQQKSGNNVDKNVEKQVNQNYDKYNKMSQNQLMNELQKEVMNSKNNGDINPKLLENFYDQMSPNMSVEQSNRLRTLINGIK